MTQIQIEESVYRELERRVEKFGETPNDVIRRLLSAPSDKKKSLNRGSDGPDHPDTSKKSGEAAALSKQGDPILHLLASTSYSLGNAKDRYFAILNFLYRKDPNGFSKLEGFKRGSRINISRDSKKIETSGNSTDPQKLNGTPYYVMANLDNRSKREILDSVLRIFDYSQSTRTAVGNSIPDSGISRPKRYY